MDRNFEFFIKILSDHLNSRYTDEVKGVDWNIITYMANIHDVKGIVYYQCKSMMPEELKLDFEDSMFLSLFNYSNRRNELLQLESYLNNEQIMYCTVKGLNIARFYPIPELRTMGDTDIVVKEGNKYRVNEILIEHGFELYSSPAQHEWIYKKNNLIYELHDRLIYPQIINTKAIELFFNDLWPFVKDGILDSSFQFLFQLVHLRKHFLNSGVGIRHFMDLAVIIKNDSNLNWIWIEEKLREFRLFEFATICFLFIEKWFGISTNISAKRLNQSFYESSTEAILSNGVFGYINSSNQKNNIINVARKSEHHMAEIAMYLKENIFPNYKSLTVNRRYFFLKNRPYLLPVAWMYRFAVGISDVRQTISIFSKFVVSKYEIRTREEYLKKWGL